MCNGRTGWFRPNFSPPLLHTDVIARDRLLDALRTAVTTRPVTLISAPAGYGKTTLLASLPQVIPDMQIAWLSLDGEENDPARLLGALIASLQRIHPEVGVGAQHHVASDARRAVTVLINLDHRPCGWPPGPGARSFALHNRATRTYGA